jgi:amino acid transporter
MTFSKGPANAVKAFFYASFQILIGFLGATYFVLVIIRLPYIITSRSVGFAVGYCVVSVAFVYVAYRMMKWGWSGELIYPVEKQGGFVSTQERRALTQGDDLLARQPEKTGS